jgi:hypothetical protein
MARRGDEFFETSELNVVLNHLQIRPLANCETEPNNGAHNVTFFSGGGLLLEETSSGFRFHWRKVQSFE